MNASPAVTFTAQPPTAALQPHSGTSVDRFFRMHFAAALFPLSGGLVLFGWRSAMVVAVVMASAATAVLLWRHVGTGGRQLRLSHALWLATLLGLMLPPHIATLRPHQYGWVLWPIMPAAGMLLVMALWVLGGVGAGRVHPVVVAWLLLTALFAAVMLPQYVLQRHAALRGNLLDVAPPDIGRSTAMSPWISESRSTEHDALLLEPATGKLSLYTRGDLPPERGPVRMTGLLRDHMPPLEDFIIGGQPGAIGTSSALAVIIGGLFLLYRGLIDFRIPLLGVLSALGAMLLLPIPARILSDNPSQWLAFRESNVGFPTLLTLANYEILSSPLLFTLFFLATSPSVRPMARRARAIYGVLLGSLVAFAQLYVSVGLGPYLALLLVGLLAPTLDKWFRPRAIV